MTLLLSHPGRWTLGEVTPGPPWTCRCQCKSRNDRGRRRNRKKRTRRTSTASRSATTRRTLGPPLPHNPSTRPREGRGGEGRRGKRREREGRDPSGTTSSGLGGCRVPSGVPSGVGSRGVEEEEEEVKGDVDEEDVGVPEEGEDVEGLLGRSRTILSFTSGSGSGQG